MIPGWEDENWISLEVLLCCGPPQPVMIKVTASDNEKAVLLFIQKLRPEQITRKCYYLK